MKYRQLGKAGIRLSAVGLGSYLTIGFRIDDDVARDTIRRAYEVGINFFDTADAYNKGRAEEVMGAALAEFPRPSIVLATKVWAPMSDHPNDRGLSAKHIAEQCEASLRRLGTDYIDLYQCHRPDPDTPLEETVRAMEDLARQGKIRYWGTSEWPAWLIARTNAVAQEIGARAAVSNQPRYSLLYRLPEAELFQCCRHEGIGNVVFSPLAHGLLTGKYAPGARPAAGTRAADPEQNQVIMKVYWNDENLKKAQELKLIAEEMGITPAQLAVAWILRREEVTSAIVGASRVSQVEDNAAAADVTLSDDVVSKLDELFPGPKESYPL